MTVDAGSFKPDGALRHGLATIRDGLPRPMEGDASGPSGLACADARPELHDLQQEATRGDTLCWIAIGRMRDDGPAFGPI